MLKGLRLIGSVAFVVGFFSIIFAGMPWYVSAVKDLNLGGEQLPWWFRGAVYLFIGGIAVVLVSLAVEVRLRGPRAEELEQAGESTGLLMANTDRIPGREVTEVLGLARGHTVYAIWLGKDISAFVRLILGGELTEYTEMMGKAREVALRRMLAQAQELGADAVLNVRFVTNSVIGSAAELLAYGTAVRLGPGRD